MPLSVVSGVDRAVFARLAAVRPLLDPILPGLSRAGDHGLLWWGTAVVLGVSRGRRRRAAFRGVLALGLASATANGPAKVVFRRGRPDQNGVPLRRRLRRDLTTFSFPSGHAASAAAFATAAAMDAPVAAIPVGILASAVAFSRVYVGVHYPSDVLAGVAIGITAALATTKVMPRRPYTPVRARPAPPSVPTLPDGAGLVVVVNEQAGGGHNHDILAVIGAFLPQAEILRAGADGELRQALLAAARRARVLGAVGGDGTAAEAAQVALDHGLPLALFPGGTLNHFATDLGLGSAEATARAVRSGTAVSVDVGRIDGVRPIGSRFGHIYLNTVSIGSYPDMVAIREKLEARMGKWPAMAFALVSVLRREPAVQVEINGRQRRLWLVFVGNGIYRPDGFAPTYRERLDEGLLDLRLVDGKSPFARTRLAGAILTGSLGRSRVYEQTSVKRVRLLSRQGPLSFAHDGEVGTEIVHLTITTNAVRLMIYREEDPGPAVAVRRRGGSAAG